MSADEMSIESEISPVRKISAGALFAGIGGFCLGFAHAGIITDWAIENDPMAVCTYERNVQHSTVLKTNSVPADITTVTAKDLQPVDVMHAGFPCQSFSQAGERKGFDDSRGQLFYEIIRLIEEFRDRKPAVLVLENSPYLRHGQGGSWFIQIASAIRRAGYWFREANCAELDPFLLSRLPQQRNRLFMVALSTDRFKNGRFDFPSARDMTPKRLTDFIDFAGAVDDESYYLPEENRYHRMISSELVDRTSIYQLRKFLVRVKEGVCPTLTANMGLGGHNVPFVFDAKGLRKLTEYECLRLQGFPAKFTFPDEVPRARRYVQIGNSVAVPVASLLADAVRVRIEREQP